MRTAEGASEKQFSLKARLRNGLTYLLTYVTYIPRRDCSWFQFLYAYAKMHLNFVVSGA